MAGHVSCAHELWNEIVMILMDNEVTFFGAAVECVFQQNYATRV